MGHQNGPSRPLRCTASTHMHSVTSLFSLPLRFFIFLQFYLFRLDKQWLIPSYSVPSPPTPGKIPKRSQWDDGQHPSALFLSQLAGESPGLSLHGHFLPRPSPLSKVKNKAWPCARLSARCKVSQWARDSIPRVTSQMRKLRLKKLGSLMLRWPQDRQRAWGRNSLAPSHLNNPQLSLGVQFSG